MSKILNSLKASLKRVIGDKKEIGIVDLEEQNTSTNKNSFDETGSRNPTEEAQRETSDDNCSTLHDTKIAEDEISRAAKQIADSVWVLGKASANILKNKSEKLTVDMKKACEGTGDIAKGIGDDIKGMIKDVKISIEDVKNGESYTMQAPLPVFGKDYLHEIKKLSESSTYLTLEEYNSMLDEVLVSDDLSYKQTAMILVLLKNGILGSKAKDIRELTVGNLLDEESRPCELFGKELKLLEQIEEKSTLMSTVVGDFKYITEPSEQRFYLCENLLYSLVGTHKAINLSLKNIYASLAIEEIANQILNQIDSDDYSVICPISVHQLLMCSGRSNIQLSLVREVLTQLAIKQTYIK